MRICLLLSIILLFAFSAVSDEQTVKTSPPEEEMVTTSFDETKAAQEEQQEVASSEEDEAVFDMVSEEIKEGERGTALSLDEEIEREAKEDALTVYTNKLTYFGYQEPDEEMYDKMYDYYSLSYPRKASEWR